MGINLEKLADLVFSMDERQEQSAKAIEMIHILVGIVFLVNKYLFEIFHFQNI